MRLIDADALLEQMIHRREYVGRASDAVCLVEDAPTVGGWISVKDRLPDTYKRILTYDKRCGVKENWLIRSRPYADWSTGFHITHWQELPEPPKEEA